MQLHKFKPFSVKVLFCTILSLSETTTQDDFFTTVRRFLFSLYVLSLTAFLLPCLTWYTISPQPAYTLYIIFCKGVLFIHTLYYLQLLSCFVLLVQMRLPQSSKPFIFQTYCKFATAVLHEVLSTHSIIYRTAFNCLQVRQI